MWKVIRIDSKKKGGGGGGGGVILHTKMGSRFFLFREKYITENTKSKEGVFLQEII